MVVDVREGQAYKITNARGGTVIDLSGAGERAPITGYNFHDGPNQKVRVRLLPLPRLSEHS